MTVTELIETLKILPQDKHVFCQLVSQDDWHAWNLCFEFKNCAKNKWVHLKIFHPDLKTLPDIKL